MEKVDISLVSKDLNKLPHYILTKLHRWIDAVHKEGIQQVRKIPGYHDEPLGGDRKGTRSIRLNRSYRAIYSESFYGTYTLIKIEEVTKHEY